MKPSTLIPTAIIALATFSPAADPAWWSTRGVKTASPSSNLSPATIGQAKHMAAMAIQELESRLTASDHLALKAAIASVVDLNVPAPLPGDWDERNRSLLLVGQLKAISAPFYDSANTRWPVWLEDELIRNGTKDTANQAHYYPWTSTTADDQNKASATIGQLKAAFALRFDRLPSRAVDTNGDGILDSYSQLPEVTVETIISEIPEATVGSIAAFRILLNAPFNSPTPVHFSIGGSASQATDYMWEGSLTSIVVPPGMQSIDLPLSTTSDQTSEADESVTLTLAPSPYYVIQEEYSQAVTVITEPDLVPSPYFFPPSGTPARVDTVCLRCPDPQAQIHYTLDGSTPTASSASIVPDTLIRVPRGAVLKAIAMKSGMPQSPQAEASYPGVAAVHGMGKSSLIISEEGRAFGFGTNLRHKFGANSSTFISAREPKAADPVLADLIQASGTNEPRDGGDGHCLYLKANGNVYFGGDNGSGQAGNNTLGDPGVITQVPGLPNDIVHVETGYDQSFAVTSAGLVYSWGKNTSAQLGLGNITSPVLTPSLVTLVSDIVQVACGGSHTLFLKRNGTVYSVGYDYGGRLGDGTPSVGYKTVPVQVGGTSNPLTGVVAIAATATTSYALKNNGVIYQWGASNLGPSVPDMVLPTAISTPGMVSIAPSDGSNLYGVDKTGEFHVFCPAYTFSGNDYGEFYEGQRGDGSFTKPNSSPLLPTGMSQSLAAGGGADHVLGLLRDGSVWAWGSNQFEQLGAATAAIPPETSSTNYRYALPAVVWSARDGDLDGIADWIDPDGGAGSLIEDSNTNGIPDFLEWMMPPPLGSTWDIDGDGISNINEKLWGTNPYNADTDGDGVDDGLDAFPNDPTRSSIDQGVAGDTTAPMIILKRPAEAIQL